MQKTTRSDPSGFCILLFTFSTLVACKPSPVPTPAPADKLRAPTVELDGSLLTRAPVSDSIGYEIDLGGGKTASVWFDTFEYELTEYGTYRVRALGDGEEYLSSDWSKSVTYGKTDESDHTHTDGDDNGYCDECGTEIIIIVDLYAINDLHGKFCDTDGQPGVDELATYLKRARENDDYSIFLSSGDMWQGSAESNLTSGVIMTEWMNALGFASMTLGNHEFDWGEDFIRDNLKSADFPFLAINVYNKDTNERADYCTPSVTVDLGVIQVGIIGAIGDCYSSISSDMVEDVYFKTGTELASLVKSESEKLKSEGADLIVYSLHDGYSRSNSEATDVNASSLASYYQSSLAPYVDVIFEGHSHKSYILRDSYGDYHLQGGGENRGISHVEIAVSHNGETEVRLAEIVSSYDYRDLEDDDETEALEDKYADVIDMAYKPLGNVNRTYGSGELSSLMAELYLEAALERWGDEYNIVLGGGYINTRSPYDLERGTRCYADALSLFPFNNRLVLCSVKGDKLTQKFLNNSSYYVHLSEYGESIRGSVNSSSTYYIIVDTYTQLYRQNGLTPIEYYDDSTYARDLLAAAIEEGRLGSPIGDGTDTDTDGGGGTHGNYTPTEISELLTVGASLKANEASTDCYYVKGKIIDTPNSKYGNLTLEDDKGNRIYVYGLYDEAGNRYDKMSNKPSLGDEITVYAPLYYYVNANDPSESKLELKDAVLIR